MPATAIDKDINDTGSRRVAVVGAGIAGLVAAYELNKAGVDVDIFERSDHVGGRTRSVTMGEFTFDTGALVLLPTYKKMVRLIHELQLDQQLHKSKPRLGIVRSGKVHSFDYQRPLRSALSTGLLTLTSKIKLLKLLPLLARYWTRLNYESMQALCELDNETTEAYCLRVLNSEINEYLADPFIRINSLTATDQAPIGEFIWLLHAYFSPHIYHLDGGMDSFSKSLAQGLNVNLSSEVLKVEQHRRGVSLQCRSDSQARIYDACVLAVPPFFAKQLYQVESEQELGYLDSVEPVPVVSLHLGLSYRPEIEDALVILPRLESKNICAIIFEHNKGAGRAPAGKAAITIQASREWTVQNAKMTDEVVRDALLAAVIPIVGDLQDKVETFFVSRWDYVCPVTYPGYFSRLQEFSNKQDRTKQKSNSAIFYAGDYFSGGMEGATISGARAARDIESYLRNDYEHNYEHKESACFNSQWRCDGADNIYR